MRLVVALTLLALATPGALAVCAATACAEDHSWEVGSCDEGGVESDATYVRQVGGATVFAYGWATCDARSGEREDKTEVGTSAATSLAGTYLHGTARWQETRSSSGTECRIDATLGGAVVASHAVACPVGPPDPGWGDLLP